MSQPAPAFDLEKLGVKEILNSLADGAYITDVDRTIIFWSRAAERITGWTSRDVVGRSCRDNLLVHVDKDGRALCGQEHCPLHRTIVTGHASHHALLVFAQNKVGKRIPVEVSVAPLRDAGGSVIGGIEVFRDLTDMMDDMWRAKVIQNHALQCHLPADPRLQFEFQYVPQEIVGGDFYHVGKLDENRYGIMIADVMGHGVAAALYCMQLRSLWEDLRDELILPGTFLSSVNRRLHTLARADGYFATAAYLVLDLATGELQCSRAGHPAPVLCQANGRTQAVGKPGMALGLGAETEYPVTTDRLEVGETLLLYTDGAVEIENEQGAELGKEGLLRLLREQGLRGDGQDLVRVEESLLKYSNRLRLADDLTLLTVRRLRL